MNGTPYTSREQRYHDNDGGFAAALAITHQIIAAECRDLPENLIATPANQYFYAIAGTPEQRRAAVDHWAARHHVTAGPEPGVGYCARVRMGASSMLCIAAPAREPAGNGQPQDAPTREAVAA